MSHEFIPCACYYCEHEDVEPLCKAKGCHQPLSHHTKTDLHREEKTDFIDGVLSIFERLTNSVHL